MFWRLWVFAPCQQSNFINIQHIWNSVPPFVRLCIFVLLMMHELQPNYTHAYAHRREFAGETANALAPAHSTDCEYVCACFALWIPLKYSTEFCTIAVSFGFWVCVFSLPHKTHQLLITLHTLSTTISTLSPFGHWIFRNEDEFLLSPFSVDVIKFCSQLEMWKTPYEQTHTRTIRSHKN